MTKLGWAIAALICFTLLVIMVQMVRVWVNELRERRRQRQLCEARVCAYYTEYLRKGTADLSHSQYHEVAKAYRYWLDARNEWEDAAGATPYHTLRMIQLYGRQARM